LVHYEIALKSLQHMADSPQNRLYLPAAIKANMVLLKQNQNDHEGAMRLALECIVLNKRFLQGKNHSLRPRVQKNLSLAYRNLTSLHEQVGDHERANAIARIAHDHAKRTFRTGTWEYYAGISLLA